MQQYYHTIAHKSHKNTFNVVIKYASFLLVANLIYAGEALFLWKLDIPITLWHGFAISATFII